MTRSKRRWPSRRHPVLLRGPAPSAQEADQVRTAERAPSSLVVVGLVAAVMGLVGALGGSYVGARASIHIADEGYQRQDAAHLRDKQEAAYADFLSAVEEQEVMLTTFESRQQRFLTSSTTKDAGAFTQYVDAETKRLLGAVLSLNHAISVLTIYGKGDAVLAALKVRTKLQEAATIASRDMVAGLPFKSLDAAVSRLGDARQEFVLATRKDLDLPGYFATS